MKDLLKIGLFCILGQKNDMLGNFIDFLNDNIYTEIRKEIKYFLSLDYS